MSSEDYRDGRFEGDAGRFSIVLPFGETILQFYMPLKCEYFAQPLPNGHWLVVGTSPDNFGSDAAEETEPNAFIFQQDGSLASSFYIGKGIEDVQTTEDGLIWVCSRIQAVVEKKRFAGQRLVCLSSDGDLISRHNNLHVSGNAPCRIIDYHVLNVVSEGDIWTYYSVCSPKLEVEAYKPDGWRTVLSEFNGRDNARQWQNLSPPSAKVFAVNNDTAIFVSSQLNPKSNSKTALHKVDLQTLETEDTLVTDESGDELKVRLIGGRGPRIYFASEDGSVLKVSVGEL